MQQEAVEGTDEPSTATKSAVGGGYEEERDKTPDHHKGKLMVEYIVWMFEESHWPPQAQGKRTPPLSVEQDGRQADGRAAPDNARRTDPCEQCRPAR